jgi:hypothetical protein
VVRPGADGTGEEIALRVHLRRLFTREIIVRHPMDSGGDVSFKRAAQARANWDCKQEDETECGKVRVVTIAFDDTPSQ